MKVNVAIHPGRRTIWSRLKINDHCEPGEGSKSENKIVGGVIPKEYIKPVEEGIKKLALSGVLADIQ